ncbi:MAG: hypothetical protein FWE32_06415 [Oscillospiraceae bacterium]|nr:hypothetical protein [Oscillospiraceae bacterium]
MRITNPMVTRNYTRNLNLNANRLDRFSRQVQTGRRFNSFSENNAGAVRAMQVRRNLDRVDANISNVRSSQGFLSTGEGMLMQITENTHTINERFLAAITGTTGEDGRRIIANELERIQEAILGLANGQFAGRYLFGGSNTITAPFTVERHPVNPADDPNDPATVMRDLLVYNGVPLRDIQPGDAIMSDGAYVDIGLGVSFNQADPTRPDAGSAFRFTLVGAQFMGIGEHNLYDTISEMIEFLQSPFDVERGSELLTQFQNSVNSVSIQIAMLGADTNFLEFSESRLLDEQLNLRERQQDLEIRPPEEAILDFKMAEFIYNATLQMGQRLLQPTLFDFIR